MLAWSNAAVVASFGLVSVLATRLERQWIVARVITGNLLCFAVGVFLRETGLVSGSSEGVLFARTHMLSLSLAFILMGVTLAPRLTSSPSAVSSSLSETPAGDNASTALDPNTIGGGVDVGATPPPASCGRETDRLWSPPFPREGEHCSSANRSSHSSEGGGEFLNVGIAFLAGSVGTIFGGVAAFVVCAACPACDFMTLPYGTAAQCTACLSAAYIGGSVNLHSVAKSVGATESLRCALAVADVLTMGLYLGGLPFVRDMRCMRVLFPVHVATDGETKKGEGSMTGVKATSHSGRGAADYGSTSASAAAAGVPTGSHAVATVGAAISSATTADLSLCNSHRNHHPDLEGGTGDSDAGADDNVDEAVKASRGRFESGGCTSSVQADEGVAAVMPVRTTGTDVAASLAPAALQLQRPPPTSFASSSFFPSSSRPPHWLCGYRPRPELVRSLNRFLGAGVYCVCVVAAARGLERRLLESVWWTEKVPGLSIMLQACTAYLMSIPIALLLLQGEVGVPPSTRRDHPYRKLPVAENGCRGQQAEGETGSTHEDSERLSGNGCCKSGLLPATQESIARYDGPSSYTEGRGGSGDNGGGLSAGATSVVSPLRPSCLQSGAPISATVVPPQSPPHSLRSEALKAANEEAHACAKITVQVFFLAVGASTPMAGITDIGAVVLAFSLFIAMVHFAVHVLLCRAVNVCFAYSSGLAKRPRIGRRQQLIQGEVCNAATEPATAVAATPIVNDIRSARSTPGLTVDVVLIGTACCVGSPPTAAALAGSSVLPGSRVR
eukprot:GHVU01031697.1.p1 GENE.GHVU01031697.1~~GHVU01031697.1.p1  ORF type:complete len:785 (+),score=74.53 GHVU01031697.1:592-2946(+)